MQVSRPWALQMRGRPAHGAPGREHPMFCNVPPVDPKAAAVSAAHNPLQATPHRAPATHLPRGCGLRCVVSGGEHTIV